jgi:hypothetical protein
VTVRGIRFAASSLPIRYVGSATLPLNKVTVEGARSVEVGAGRILGRNDDSSRVNLRRRCVNIPVAGNLRQSKGDLLVDPGTLEIWLRPQPNAFECPADSLHLGVTAPIHTKPAQERSNGNPLGSVALSQLLRDRNLTCTSACDTFEVPILSLAIQELG